MLPFLAATVEALIHYIKLLSSVGSFWDESNTFVASFGLYKNSPSGTSYDRSMFLELYNASDRYYRDLKGERSVLINLRINLALNFHLESLIDFSMSERKTHNDGLLQRFLFHAPEPKFPNTQQMRACPPLECSMKVILLVLRHLHSAGRCYELTPAAGVLFDEIFNATRALIRKLDYEDPFLR